MAESLYQRQRTLEWQLRRGRGNKMPPEFLAEIQAKLDQAYRDMEIHMIELDCKDCKERMFFKP